jgi:hypothetical protein
MLNFYEDGIACEGVPGCHPRKPLDRSARIRAAPEVWRWNASARASKRFTHGFANLLWAWVGLQPKMRGRRYPEAGLRLGRCLDEDQLPAAVHRGSAHHGVTTITTIAPSRWRTE